MVTITEVRDRRYFKEFVKFQYDLYADDPLWVPYLRSEVNYLFSPRNPFWRHATRALFLARLGKDVVGRITAIKDDELIKFTGEPLGVFGFYESVDDVSVAQALYGAACEWLKGRGLTAVRGPMNPSTNEECGFLLEGFDTPPYIMMTHTPAYYLRLAEAAGFRKAMDLQAFFMKITRERRERLERTAEAVRRRLAGLEVRPVNIKDFKREVELVRQIYNRAWEDNWGFVPATAEEFEDVAKRLKALVEPRLVWIATVNGDPAGFLMALPNYNEVLKKMRGSTGPIALWKFFWGKRKIRGVRLMLFGICREYRQRGIDAVLMAESYNAALALGYSEAEFSWVLENNEMTNRAAAMWGAKVYKKYRIYQKDL